MEILPKIAEKIEIENATVDFFKYIEDGITTYQFDTSRCGPPEPMVNAMVGLQMLKDNDKLVMINHQSPGGLFPKIVNEFDFEIEDLDGLVKVIFTRKNGACSSTNFNSSHCAG